VFTARYGINLLNIAQLIFFFIVLIITQFDDTDALRNGRRSSMWVKYTHVNTKIYTVRLLTIVLDAARCHQDFTPQCLKNWITFRLQV